MGFGMFVVVPVIAMMLNHQRRMAELMHGKKQELQNVSDERLARLERNLDEVRSLVHELVIRTDGPLPLRERETQQPPSLRL